MVQSLEAANEIVASYPPTIWTAIDRVTHAETRKNRVTTICKVGMSCRVGEEPKNESRELSIDRTLHPHGFFSLIPMRYVCWTLDSTTRMHSFVSKPCARIGALLLISLSLQTGIMAQALGLTKKDTKFENGTVHERKKAS